VAAKKKGHVKTGRGDKRMTIKDLQKLIENQQSTETEDPKMVALLQRVRKSKFFDWFDKDHKKILNVNESIGRKCSCFTCQLGWPIKNSKRYPLFDYQLQVFRALTEPPFINARKATEEDERWYDEQKKLIENVSAIKDDNKTNAYQRLLRERQVRLSHPQRVKHCAILKASALGISELVLRFILWLCLKDNNLRGSQIIIIVGPRLELAVSLCSRLKDLLKNLDITFTDKETVLNLNGVRIECFPSHHVDSARGLPNVSLIYVDEASFIPDREIDNCMDILLRNIPKSNPWLIISSTPQKPMDMMDQIMKEDPSTSIWKQIWLDYKWGIGKIYDAEEINKIRSSRSFNREFCLKFSGLAGNVLDPAAIDRCISTGGTLAKTAPLDDWSIPTKYVMSVDIGWGSSATAIMVSRFINGKVQIIYSREFTRPIFADIISEIWKLKSKCNGNLQNILMDASATELYTTLCNEFDQNPSQQYLKDQQAQCKKLNIYLENRLFVCPIPFNPQGKSMLNHTQRMISETEDDGSAMVGLHSSFSDLITACRSAYSIEDKLDKERGVFADTFDSLLMNLSWYRWSK
jgi:hypothetical protein